MSNKTCQCSEHPPCMDCNQPLRAKGTSESDHPGTVSSRQKDICNKCMYAKSQGYAPQNPQTLAATNTTLNAYMTNRRNRGIPITGLRKTA